MSSIPVQNVSERLLEREQVLLPNCLIGHFGILPDEDDLDHLILAKDVAGDSASKGMLFWDHVSKLLQTLFLLQHALLRVTLKELRRIWSAPCSLSPTRGGSGVVFFLRNNCIYCDTLVLSKHQEEKEKT